MKFYIRIALVIFALLTVLAISENFSFDINVNVTQKNAAVQQSNSYSCKTTSETKNTLSEKSVNKNDSPQKMYVWYYAEILSNNSVGNDWSFNCSVNGIDINDGKYFYITPGDKIKIHPECQENDKYPDYGGFSFVYNAPSDLSEYFYVEKKVTVVEDRGKYAGNKAVILFTVYFEPV